MMVTCHGGLISCSFECLALFSNGKIYLSRDERALQKLMKTMACLKKRNRRSWWQPTCHSTNCKPTEVISHLPSWWNMPDDVLLCDSSPNLSLFYWFWLFTWLLIVCIKWFSFNDGMSLVTKCIYVSKKIVYCKISLISRNECLIIFWLKRIIARLWASCITLVGR